MSNSMGKGRAQITKEADEKKLAKKLASEERKKAVEEKYTIIDGKKYIEIDGELKVYNSNNAKTTSLDRINEYGVKFNALGKPKKMYQELIKEYVKNGEEAKLANNTIIDLIEKDVLKYKKAFDNMVNYADCSVFKTVPHQVLRECETFGLVAQEYSKKKVEAMAGSEVFIIPTQNTQCRKCRKFRAEQYFYVVDSEFGDGMSCICKECAMAMFIKIFTDSGSIKDALMAVLFKIDTPIDIDIVTDLVSQYSLEEMQNKLNSGVIIGDYLTKYHIQNQSLKIDGYDCSVIGSNFGNVLFKDVQRLCKGAKSPICRIVQRDENEDADTDEELEEMYESMSKQKINKLKSKWGSLDLEDLKFLENRYSFWCNSCEVTPGAMEALLAQICFEELNIFKARQNNKADMSKMVKTYQELLKSANLTPKQQSAISQSSEFASLGDFIKKCEQTRPIISRNKEYVDINGYEKQGRILAGCVSRTLGKTNAYVNEFEESFKEHTIDFDQMSDE